MRMKSAWSGPMSKLLLMVRDNEHGKRQSGVRDIPSATEANSLQDAEFALSRQRTRVRVPYALPIFSEPSRMGGMS